MEFFYVYILARREWGSRKTRIDTKIEQAAMSPSELTATARSVIRPFLIEFRFRCPLHCDGPGSVDDVVGLQRARLERRDANIVLLPTESISRSFSRGGSSYVA